MSGGLSGGPDFEMDAENHIGSIVPIVPTVVFYSNLQLAFDHFNRELFDSKLPNCLLTLRSANRFYGYHHSKRFIAKNGDLLDELGLHPGFFALRPLEVGLSTLVHEMVHHWQDHFGTPTRSNPHNVEWSQKMEEIGLMPSSTEAPGGRKTGRKMSHYLIPNGAYIQSCKRLLDTGFDFAWYDRHAPTDLEVIEKRLLDSQTPEVQELMGKAPAKWIEPPKPPRVSRPLTISDQSLAETDEAKDEMAREELNPRSTSPVIPKQPVLYSPPPKKVSTQIRMFCRGCNVRVTLSKEAKLICAGCEMVFERVD